MGLSARQNCSWRRSQAISTSRALGPSAHFQIAETVAIVIGAAPKHYCLPRGGGHAGF